MIRAWLILFVAFTLASAQAVLPSWNQGAAKQRIVQFVTEVTTEGHQNYLTPRARIAVFDMDGTLIVEKPVAAQVAFIFDSVRMAAKTHPKWATQDPFKAVLNNNDQDAKALLSWAQVDTLVNTTQTGMSPEAYGTMALQFFRQAKHPRFRVAWPRLIYRPMTELVSYLRRNGFTIYICTGSDQSMVRVLAPKLFGVPVGNIMGSHQNQTFQAGTGQPQVLRGDNKAVLNIENTKVISIYRRLGLIPAMVVGNSDGDTAMLTYSQQPGKPSLQLLVHHDDAAREYAYDAGAQKVLAQAEARKWTVISMKSDFKTMF